MRPILLFGMASLLFAGCRVAPLQVVPQPQAALPFPRENPKVPPPSAEAAWVPEGYKAELVIQDLIYPTSLEFDSDGNLYVAEGGYVYGDPAAPTRLLQFNRQGQVRVLTEALNAPITDLLWHQDRLFISHKGKVSMWDGSRLTDLVTGLPSHGDHYNNQLTAGPDGKIYLGQGTVSNAGVVGVDNFVFGWLMRHPELHDVSPYPLRLRGRSFVSLNPLKLSNERENLLANTGAFQPFGRDARDTTPTGVKANGTVLRFNPDGSGLEVYAWGLRNPFGLAWGPDEKLYATDNGYDERGSRPIANAPDVIWEVRRGAWYGFPDFVAGRPVTDPQFKPEKAEAPKFLLREHPPVEKPLLVRPPHAALAKVDFSPGGDFGFEGEMFVAEVGDMQPITGNDDRPVGFQVVRIDLKSREVQPFFKARSDTLGREFMEHVTTPGPRRPIDVRFSPSGDALYIVDIGAILMYPSPTPSPQPYPGSGAIWRISRKEASPEFPIGLSMAPGKARGMEDSGLMPTGREEKERREREEERLPQESLPKTP